MSEELKIKRIFPQFVIEGAEIEIESDGFDPAWERESRCVIDGKDSRIIAASRRRLLVVVPEMVSGSIDVELVSDGVESAKSVIKAGRKVVSEMHIVANPAIDPADDSMIVTISGPRGQYLPTTLFRVTEDGDIEDIFIDVLNPTGLAFDSDGVLHVSNRADGEIYSIRDGRAVLIAEAKFGVATGIAFDSDGELYIGDRGGTIFRIRDFGDIEVFAELEPSVSAYHLAFGPDGRLFVTAPGLSSHDSIYAIDPDGNKEVYVRGFGRPQGMAFDTNGNLYIAACYESRHGIVKIDAETREPELLIGGNSFVGLCFDRKGNLLAATADSVYSLPIGASGILLD